jgi:hypothetical protein
MTVAERARTKMIARTVRTLLLSNTAAAIFNPQEFPTLVGRVFLTTQLCVEGRQGNVRLE